METELDVLVVGAGPVGLMLAGELALAGASVEVVDRLEAPSTTIKAGSLTLLTAEAFDRRGLLPELTRVHQSVMELMAGFMSRRGPAPARPGLAGHFAGMMRMDPGRLPHDEPDLAVGPAVGAVLVPQHEVERILVHWAMSLGVRVRPGCEVVRLVDDGAGVTAELATGERRRAGWLVGCDGGRSTVRRAAGFDFPGTDPTITGHQAVADIANPEMLPVGWNRTPTGMVVYGPVPGRVLTVEFDGPPADRDEPVTVEELQASLRHVSGTDVTVKGIVTATRFTDNARQAATYRMGRVLLAGDAAHVHSPFGGQGLNLGIGDAVNLGWKLAATIQGRAPEGLLGTYTEERHPVGAWVLDWTRAQVALMRPDPQTTALRSVVADLMDTDDGNAYFLEKLSGIRLRYPNRGGDHALVGGRVPELRLTDAGGATRLAELCHDGRPVLLDLAGARRSGGGWSAVGECWSNRVHVVSAGCPDRPDLSGLLVRPDGIVAWAAGSQSAGEPALRDALSRWFGHPTGERSTARAV